MSTTKTCPSCGRNFNCDSESDSSKCWCNQYPAIMPLTPGKGCLCPECLQKEIKQAIEAYVSKFKRGEIINDAPRYAVHKKHLMEGLDYYIEDKRWVFTSWYLLKRGFCCKNGCRHCPYGFTR